MRSDRRVSKSDDFNTETLVDPEPEAALFSIVLLPSDEVSHPDRASPNIIVLINLKRIRPSFRTVFKPIIRVPSYTNADTLNFKDVFREFCNLIMTYFRVVSLLVTTLDRRRMWASKSVFHYSQLDLSKKAGVGRLVFLNGPF